MPVPTPIKTWTWTSNQRSTFVTVLQCTKDILYGFKTGFLSLPGATVKGSSVGATSSMDGVDRWTSSTAIGGRVVNRTTNATSWIVIDTPSLGTDVEVMLAFVDTTSSSNSVIIGVSVTGQYTVSNTQTPSATDEWTLGTNSTTSVLLSSTSANYDRIWSFGKTTDGQAVIMLVARAGVSNFIGVIQAVTSTVVAPAAFDPPVIGFSSGPGTTVLNTLANFLAMAGAGSFFGAARVFNGTSHGIAALMGGSEAYGNSASVTVRQTFLPELQGGGAYLTPELSLWSETLGFRGKLGNAVDMWAAPQGAMDGHSVLADGTRPLIVWGPLVIPWDGSVPVLV